MISTLYKQFPTLNINDRYQLREQSADDSADFLAYYQNPSVNQHILATAPTTLAQSEQEIAYCRKLFYQRTGLYWAICPTDTQRMIGAIGLYINNNHHRAEICYDLAESHWRQGIMYAAIARVIHFCFQEQEFQRIEALTTNDNQPSIQLLEKLGFTREATLRSYRYFQNRPHDVELYAIMP